MTFTPASLSFLRRLARNNDKEWFEAHREEYETAVRAPMRELVEELDVGLATVAPEIVGDPKRSIFRIHRDVRFSKDKSPYKTHAACWLTHRAAGPSAISSAHGGAGFYFHLEPRGSMVAGGIYMPPRPSLDRIREAIAEDPEAFAATVEARAFERRFGGLTQDGMLKRLPRGYAAGHPAERWLRFRSFTTSRPLADDDVLSPTLPAMLMKDFALMLPLVRWLNGVLGLPAMERR